MVGALKYFGNEVGYRSKNETSKETMKKIKAFRTIGAGALRADEIEQFLAER